MKIYWICLVVLFFPVILKAKKRDNYLVNQAKHFCVIKEDEKLMKKLDFRNISNQDIPDYNIKVDELGTSIYFQLCTPLKKECNGQGGFSICLNKENKEIGLGKYDQAQVKFENFQATFKFSGEKCNETSNYTTTVIMKCDHNASKDKSFPQVFPFGKDQCDIFLYWTTNYACGEEHQSNCSVTDESGYEYDLSNLIDRSNNYDVSVNKSSKILLNVCHSLIFGHGVPCQGKAAACLVDADNLSDKGLLLGDLKSPPSIIKEGLLEIEYLKGDLCPQSFSGHIKTVITFICDLSAKDSSPKYVNNRDLCDYYLEWRTPLACKVPSENHIFTTKNKKSGIVSSTTPKTKELLFTRSTSNYQVNCTLTTKNGEIDLTPLILKNDNYVVKDKDSEFYINVCTSLTSTSKFKACRSSSACKLQRDKNGVISNETSLGNSSGSLMFLQGRNVVLQYKNGASCQQNQREKISTNVTFICNYNANKGTPLFDEYKDCTYLFKWETIFVCDTVIGNFYDNCTISNPLSRTIDLSVLRNKTFNVKKADENKNYSINVCGEKNICNGSTVCEGTNEYGSSINVIFEYPKDSVKLEFTKGTKCSNELAKSDITFKCNSTAGVGSPVLISESPISQCHPRFEWQTILVCTSPDKTSSNHGLLITFIVFGLSIILIVISCKNPSRRARCYRIFSNPCSSSSNDRVQYCRVNTTEEARVLLENCDPTTVQSDSDDDLLGA